MKKRLLYLIYSLLFFLPAIGFGQANHIVISEVYGGGGNTGATYTNDFVELYNPTGSSVDLTNWSVQYSSAAGTTWAAQTLTGSIRSHGFYLIQLAAGTTVTNKPLPVTADASSTTINLSATTGKVALVNNSTALAGAAPTGGGIIDLLGYYLSGTVPSTFETAYATTTPAPANSNIVSFERKANANSTATTLASGGTDELAGNGYDTDNNSTDFVVQTVSNPQNSTSPIEPVATPTLIAAPTSLDFGTTQTVSTTSAAQTFTLSGTNLTADASLTATGPYTFSVDNGSTYVTSGTILKGTLATAQNVLVKFTPTTTTASPGSISITSTGAATQTVTLTGTGAAAVPTLTASTATLAFGTVNTTTPSVLNYTLSGANLATGSVTIAASPSSYLVSKLPAGPFTSTIVFTSAQIATSPKVYVQFSPTAAGSIPGTITTTDPDVTSGPTVTLTGTGVIPTLTPSTATVAFGNVTVNTTSGSQQFTITGANLTGAVSLAIAPTTSNPFQFSIDNGTTWVTSTSIATFVSPQTVLVRYNAPATPGSPSGYSISISSNGAAAQSVSLTATAVAAPVPLLALSATSLTFSSFVGTPTAAQSYTLTGTNISGSSSVTVAAPYSVSKTLGGTYTTSLAYTTTDFPSGSGVQTVYVKFTPTVVGIGGANSGSAINATTSGTSQTVTLNGTGVGVPLLTPSLTSLSISAVNTKTAVQSFQLSGAYITTNTVLTATGPYLLSKDNITFSATLTYTIADMASAQTVYVQFTAPATLGAVPGSIAITSTGANSTTVTLNGTSLGTPALSVTPATLTFGLASSLTAVTSTAQTFTLTGANITANTTVTATAPYQLSKDGVTYSTSLTYLPAEMATVQTVYVTFSISPTSVVGSTTSSIAIASTGAANATVTLTGNVLNTPPTLAAIADQSACFSTALQTIPLTGITAGVETYQNVVVSVTSSNPALFASLGTSPILAGVSAINYTLVSGVSGTAIITVTVKDNGLAANGGNDTFVRTFNFVVNPLVTLVVTSDVAGNTVERGSTSTLTVTGGVAGATYSWASSVAAGIITSSTTGTSITIRPTAFATYTVTSTNACGTSIKGSLGIEVRNAPSLETSNVITPNGDGKNDFWVIRNIDLYPGNTVKVFDKSGKIVFTKTGYNNDWNGYYNGSPLPQGSYIYVIDLGTGFPYRGVISIVRD